MVIFVLQEGSPFIVNMTYAFQTPEKLCFILDLMNGGDLHYHLSQHGVFNEREVRFYASEVILGLEHMHNRYVVYRDLKVRLLLYVNLLSPFSMNCVLLWGFCVNVFMPFWIKGLLLYFSFWRLFKFSNTTVAHILCSVFIFRSVKFSHLIHEHMR